MNIPKQILKATKHLQNYGGSVVYLGKYEGKDVYYFRFDRDDLAIGYPEVYLMDKNGNLEIIQGKESFEILDLFIVEDIDE